MTDGPLDNRTLAAALGPHEFRVQGIEASQLALLGRGNLDRLVILVAEAANYFLSEGASSREDLELAQRVRLHLQELRTRCTEAKPIRSRSARL